MPLSLNLPYGICLPATRLARRLRGLPSRERQEDGVDPSEKYFLSQYRTTPAMAQRFMGPDFSLTGHRVVDIGCGLGGRAPAWLEAGAAGVVNVDINRTELDAGRQLTARLFAERAPFIEFKTPDDLVIAHQTFDRAILFDSFEHLVDPAAVLKQVHACLGPGGLAWIGSFGWYHYAASHCTGEHVPIPWCQMLFSERAILDTIRTVIREPGYVPNQWEQAEGITRWDGITTLKDRPGEPLNMLSLRAIRRILSASPLEVLSFRTFGFSGRVVPAAGLLSLLAQVPIVQEVFHSYYTAVLRRPDWDQT